MDDCLVRRKAAAGIFAGLLVSACVTASVGRAETVDDLRRKRQALAATERGALLRLYAVEAAAARARHDAARLEIRVRELDREVRATRRYAAIARASLAASRSRVARALRLLYVEGPPIDAIALILGAGSFDEAIDGLESLRFAAAQNHRLARLADARDRALRAAASRLAERSAALHAARDAATSSVRRLELVIGDRARYIAALRERLRLTDSTIATLSAAARAAARRAALIQARAVARTRAASGSSPSSEVMAASAVLTAQPAAPAAVTEPLARGPVTGTERLVVRATAYTLPGRTASGLPVGHGVIAVDPMVIPLGTRVHVPGYGDAVAADTGGAVQGAVIDVWLPTTAAALAWGVRTVTITVYRS